MSPWFDFLFPNEADDRIFGPTGKDLDKADPAPGPNNCSDIVLQILEVFAIALAWILHADIEICGSWQLFDLADDRIFVMDVDEDGVCHE